MADPFPLVDVAVVLVTDARGERLLADYNAHWQCFSLPMTTVGELPGAAPGAAGTPEPPSRAAARAAAEVLGRPLPPGVMTRLNVDIPPYQRSGRDGTWKRYSYEIYALKAADPHPLPGHAAVWLTPGELQEGEPVSPTVRHILTAVSLADVRRALRI